MNGHRAFQILKLGVTRCYLIECPEGYLLIDTSYQSCFPSFQAGMANLGKRIADIRYLLLTHHHDDHAGFAAELVSKAGCRVIIHRKAIMPLEQGRSETVMTPANRRVKLALSLYTAFHRDFSFPPLLLDEEDIVLSDDSTDALKNIGVDGRILCTPGHTQDSISVLLSDGTAFVGDAAMNFLRWTGVGHLPVYAEDFQAVAESWRKLLEEGAHVIYPAHGKPFSAAELMPRTRL